MKDMKTTQGEQSLIPMSMSVKDLQEGLEKIVHNIGS